MIYGANSSTFARAFAALRLNVELSAAPNYSIVASQLFCSERSHLVGDFFASLRLQANRLDTNSRLDLALSNSRFRFRLPTLALVYK